MNNYDKNFIIVLIVGNIGIITLIAAGVLLGYVIGNGLINFK